MAAKWYVEFRDHLEIIRRVPGYKDKRATQQFGRRLEQLTACRSTGADLDLDTVRWMEALSAPMLERLAEIGLVWPNEAASSRSLDDHINDWEHCQTLTTSGPASWGNRERHPRSTLERSKRGTRPRLAQR